MLISKLISAQNLVPNPSFEHYDSCPDFYSELSYATGWLAFSPSPDYFNSCDLSQFVGCNKNFAGMQNPFYYLFNLYTILLIIPPVNKTTFNN